jgi:hypothetical protein
MESGLAVTDITVVGCNILASYSLYDVTSILTDPQNTDVNWQRRRWTKALPSVTLNTNMAGKFFQEFYLLGLTRFGEELQEPQNLNRFLTFLQYTVLRSWKN